MSKKYQYFQYMAFSRYPLYTEIIYIKATSKENAIKQIKKRLDKIGIGFRSFGLLEIPKEEYYHIKKQNNKQYE